MKKILSALLILIAVSVSAQEKIYAPTLSTPANNAVNQVVNVLLDWNPVAAAVKYEVNLDTSATFSNPQDTVVIYSAWQSSVLLFGTTYYWRVRAIDANDVISNWSIVRSFNTVAAPTTLWPAAGSKTASLDPLLKWNAMSGVTKYECQFDSAATFDSPWFRSGIVENDTKFQVYDNYYGDNYYYRVRGIHVNDTSNWSVAVGFMTRDSVAFYSTSPANNAIDIHPADTLRIKSIVGTEKYEINFDTDPTFTAPIVFYWDSAAMFIKLVSGITYDTLARGAIDTIPFGTFNYRLRLITDGDTSKWTAVRTLSTVNKVTMLTPADDATEVDPATAFTWESIRGAAYYILEYDTVPAFTNITKVNVAGTSYTPTTHLVSQTNYYWRVRCVTHADTTDMYDEFHFKTYWGVGVEESPVETWSVYPNPTNGVFHLNIESASVAKVEILNLLGDVVYFQNNLPNGSNTISIENLNDGIYMMRLYMDDKLYTSRIVKK
ncbi:MAG: hypothetical protein A2W93_12530 [Bacteroidetes bacterium GWF2_43_63]|nr:MAG: hypothetical protein A2W94_06785 [Bacteroidetes bacterium GWE2_42_42]OFY56489.1 MAG: hypothetical protein A2W93_12530 [Bacteroidetes bacterium GWF2_43_63]HBG71162.1 hypothetical protein [Bacteroidales bacterium]HCB61245.1 hypothetical protein [Bacteroidales bacterium]HCY23262.1 hypothetical protein [Bacteroidales bacterium]